MAYTEPQDMGALGKIGYILQNTANPQYSIERENAIAQQEYKKLQNIMMLSQLAELTRNAQQTRAMQEAMGINLPEAPTGVQTPANSALASFSQPAQQSPAMQPPSLAPLPESQPTALASVSQPQPAANSIDVGRRQQQEMLRRLANANPEKFGAEYAKSLATTPDERKQQLAEQSEKERVTANVNRVEDFVLPGIDEAIDFAKKNYISVNKTVGGVLESVPGTKAFSLREKMQPIKSALSIDKLQQMKDNSPTGASGLGPLAVKELEALEKSVASLEIGQETKDLIANMNKVKKHYSAWVDIMKKAKPEDFAGGVKPDMSGQQMPSGKLTREEWLKKSPMLRSKNAQ